MDINIKEQRVMLAEKRGEYFQSAREEKLYLRVECGIRYEKK
jgi:hypothetical protein